MNHLVFSDLHLHEHPLFTDVTMENENVFVDIALHSLNQMISYSRDHEIDTVSFLGDLLDSRYKTPIRLIVLLQEYLNHWMNSCPKIKNFFILRGTPSHDGEGKNFSSLLMRPIQKIITVSDTLIHDTGKEFLCYVPYYQKDKLKEDIKRLSEKIKGKPKYLFLHSGFKGSKVFDYEIKNDKDLLDISDVRDFKLTIAGHFHKYQQVARKIYHVGSPYRITFSEKEDGKGFIHLIDDEVRFEALNCPGMIEISIDTSDIEIHGTAVKGCFIKIKVIGNERKLSKFNYESIKQEFLSKGAYGVKFERINTDEKEEVKEIRIKKEDDLEKMVDRYLELVKPEIGDLNVPKLRRIAFRSLTEYER